MKKSITLLLLCVAFLCCTVVTARTWTAGKFQKEGKLVSLTEDGQGVRIQLDSGEIVRVPLSSLSEKDVKYVMEHADPFVVEKNETQNDAKAILTQLQKKFFPGMSPEEIASIKELHWRGKPIQDEDLFILTGLPLLEFLDIRDCENITDFGLQYIKGLSHLERLNIGATTITNKGNITDAGLENLKELKQLKGLAIDYCYGISDAGLENLKGLNKLEKLILWNLSITDEGLACLENLVELRVLSLESCDNITDAGLIHLYGLKNLENLYTSQGKYNCKISKDALNNLWKEIKAKKDQDNAPASTDEETKTEEVKEEETETTSALPAPIEEQDQTKTETNVKNTQSGTGQFRMSLNSFTIPAGFQLFSEKKMETEDTKDGCIREYHNNNGESIQISDSTAYYVLTFTMIAAAFDTAAKSDDAKLKATMAGAQVKDITVGGKNLGSAMTTKNDSGFGYLVSLKDGDSCITIVASAKSLQLLTAIDNMVQNGNYQ